MKVADLLYYFCIWGLFFSQALSCEGKDFYQAPDCFLTERLLLRSIRTASQEIQSYEDTVFNDNPQAEGRDTNWKTKEEIGETALVKERTDY